MMRPAIIRSRTSWLVPARRFWFASASWPAVSLMSIAFLKVVSVVAVTINMIVVAIITSTREKPSSLVKVGMPITYA